jgi:hypothetical protein
MVPDSVILRPLVDVFALLPVVDRIWPNVLVAENPAVEGADGFIGGGAHSPPCKFAEEQLKCAEGAVGPVFVRSQNVVPLVVAAEPLAGERASLPVRGGHDVAVRPVSSVPFSRVEESKPPRWRGAAVWIAGGMALAVALGSGWMLYQKSRATPQTTAALRIVPSSSLPVNEKDELAAAPARDVRKPQAPSIRQPSPAVARHLNGSPAPLACGKRSRRNSS